MTTGHKKKNSLPGKNISQSINTENGSNRQRKVFLWLLILVSVLVYTNTIDHGYVYDDFSVITENRIVTKGFSAIPEILSTPYRWGYFHTSNDMYRPLSLVMFAMEYQAFEGKPAISHLINILIYACCVWVLFIFLDLLFSGKKTAVAFMASLFFAVHPVHTEVVANIKSRDELLCFLFAISGLIFFTKYHATGRMKQLVTGSLLFLLSLLSKETSISLLAIIPIVFFLYRGTGYKRNWLIVACCVLSAGIFLTIRYHILYTHNANNLSDVLFIDNFLTGAPGEIERIATAILIMGLYLLKLLIPYPLLSDYSYNSIPFVGFGSIWVWLSLLSYLLLVVVCIVRLFKKHDDSLAFGIVFYLLSIALFSNILFLTGAAMAERFLFFASAGFCWCVAVLIEKWATNENVISHITEITTNKKVLGITVALSLLLAGMSISRNADWVDNMTLFSTDISQSPDNARLNYYLGNEIFKGVSNGGYNPIQAPGKINEAKWHLYRAVNIYPMYTDAYKALGKGYYVTGLFDSAEYFYKKTLSIKQDDIEAWSDLDVVYYNSKKYRQSIDVCKQILAIDSTMIYKYQNIGTCFMQLAQYDSAIYYLQKGIPDAADKSSLYKTIAVAFRLRGNEDSARQYELLLEAIH